MLNVRQQNVIYIDSPGLCYQSVSVIIYLLYTKYTACNVCAVQLNKKREAESKLQFCVLFFARISVFLYYLGLATLGITVIFNFIVLL